MRILIIVLLLIGGKCSATGYDYSATEIQSIDYHLNESFFMIERYFHDKINKTKKSPIIHISKGLLSFDYILNGMANFEVLSKGKQSVSRNRTRLFYNFTEVFTFELDVTYIINLGILPISGDCLLKLTYSNASYSIDIKNMSIIPSTEGKYELEILKINNKIAVLMNLSKYISNTVEDFGRHFDKYIKHCFENDVEQFYRGYFANTNYYIYFPFLRNTTINVRHKLENIIAGGYNNTPMITAYYNRNYAMVEEPEAYSYDLNYMKCVNFSINEVIRIFNSEIRLLKNIILRQSHLVADCAFKLDTRSFARIFPELLYYPNNYTGTLTFNGYSGNITGKFIPESNLVRIENAIVSVTGHLPTIETYLFKVTLKLSGDFEPRFYNQHNDKMRLYMGLTAKEINFRIDSVEKGWNNQYAMINRRGLRKFLYDMINFYFIELHKDDILGSGILISYSLPVKMKSFTMNEITMLIILDKI